MTNKYASQCAHSPLLSVFEGKIPAHRPVWFMRQAGRSLPEYRAVRANIAMLDSCFNPDLVTEITLQPVRRHGVDAAIFYSDIVVPLKAAGFPIEIKSGIGPVTDQPIRTSEDIFRFPQVTVEALEPISLAVQQIIQELGDIPLIGFAGAPYTLASYLIEGGPSKNHEKTKAFMYGQTDLWHQLLDKIADLTITFLQVQISSGAKVIQLFDSWAGTLAREDYRTYVLPHSQKVLTAVQGSKRIHFGIGTSNFISDMALGVDGIGLDWRLNPTQAYEKIARPVVLQGNLDPAYLFTSQTLIEDRIKRICADADQAIQQGALGHIFNLGHGVPAQTDPGVLTAIVDFVHSL